MKEIFLSLLESFRQRFKSPFVGTYIISFLVFNWWPVSIYLFSKKEIEHTVNELTKAYSRPGAYLWPLLFSAIYIIALPYFNALFDLIGTKASLMRIKTRNKVKHEGLEQDVKTAELERKIADERAGTNEKQTILFKLQAAERQIESANILLTEQQQKHKEEQTDLTQIINKQKSEIEYLKSIEESLNNNQKNLGEQLKFYEGVYPYLIKNGQSAKIEISQFLKKYLNDGEILMLKEDVSAQGRYPKLPHRGEVNELLVKAGIYYYDEKQNLFYITESGVKFVNNLL